MARHILGIDIRSHAISSVLVKTTLKGRRIEAQAQVAISEHQDVERSLSVCLNTINNAVPLSGAVCLVSFSAEQISFRNLQVPFKEQKKIRQILSYELEPLLLRPVEDLIIDFFQVRSGQDGDIVTAAIEKLKLEPCLAALAAFNLEPKIITAGGYATACCLARLSNIPENCIYLDVNHTECTLCLVAAGSIHFIRSFATAADAPPDADMLETEIKRTTNAFTQTSSKNYRPDTILISGSGISDDTLIGELSRKFEGPVQPLDLARTKDLLFGNAVQQQWQPRQMDSALALALIELEDIEVLNFRKGPFAVKTHWIKYKNEMIKSGILAGLIVVLFLASMIAQSFTLKKKIDHLDAKIKSTLKAAFPEVQKFHSPLEQMQIRLKSARQRSDYPQEAESKVRHIDILNDISRLVPANVEVELNRLVTGPEVVLISGQTDTFNSVNNLKNSLEKGLLFEKITISSANIDKAGNRVRFKLKIQLHSTMAIDRTPPSETDGRKS